MKIKYLKDLENFPDGIELFNNRGIAIEEIEALEVTYNSGNKFPQVLRELLFIAGDYCVCFDYWDNITEMNIEVRDRYSEVDLSSIEPFVCVDCNGGFGNSSFLYVKCNENVDDPFLWTVELTKSLGIKQIVKGGRLSDAIIGALDLIKAGKNPF